MSEAFEPEPAAAAVDRGTPAPQAIIEVGLRKKLRTSVVMNAVLGVTVVALGGILIGTLLRPAAVPAEATPSPSPTSVETTETTGPGSSAAGTLAEQVARNDPQDTMAFGNVEAPLVVVEWLDYRCPFCAKYTNETLPIILRDYVETGKVRYEVHDAAFFGDQSALAAVGARAAAAQGRFGEYLSVLFAAAPVSGHPDLPRETLIAFAQQAGVADLAAFTTALDDPNLLAEVARATSTAQQLGVNSVPFFVIGDEVTAGALPTEEFRALLDAQLEVHSTTP